MTGTKPQYQNYDLIRAKYPKSFSARYKGERHRFVVTGHDAEDREWLIVEAYGHLDLAFYDQDELKDLDWTEPVEPIDAFFVMGRALAAAHAEHKSAKAVLQAKDVG